MNKLKSIVKTSVVSSGVLLISACSTGPSLQETCTATDWRSEGYKTGVKGESADHVLNTEKKCSKEGYSVSVVDYKEGWLKGIEKYCSPDNAFKLGVKGDEATPKNCPVELRTKFNENYKRAENYLENKKVIAKKEKEISDLKQSVSQLEQEKTKLIDEQSKIEQSADQVSSKSVKYDIK